MIDQSVEKMTAQLLQALKDNSKPLDLDALVRSGVLCRRSANRYQMLAPMNALPRHVRAQATRIEMKRGRDGSEVAILTFPSPSTSVKRTTKNRELIEMLDGKKR